MAVIRVRGGQLNVDDVATEISNDSSAIATLAAGVANDPGAVQALAASFFPLTGGVITGETILCYTAPCIWFKDPNFPGCDTGALWRPVVRNGVFGISMSSGSFQLAPPFVQPGPPGSNGFIAQGPPVFYNNFVPGYLFSVCGTAGNDGIYTVASPVQPFGPDTLIPVTKTIPNQFPPPGGSISDFTFETEMLQLSLIGGVTVPTGTTLKADGGLEVQSFFDVFVDIDMGSNKVTNLASGTVSGDALHFGQIGTQVQAFDTELLALSLVSTDGFYVRSGVNAFARTLTGTALRLSITNGNGGAGDPVFNIDTGYVGQASITTLGTITSGSWDAVDIAITAGGTGASSALAARANLGLAIGTDVQAFDATLTSIAALGTVADRVAYTTGVDTWAETPLTAFARTLIDDATALAARSTLGVVIGTDVQAWDADLDGVAALAGTGIVVHTGAGTFTERTILGGVGLTATNGSGVAGDPSLAVDAFKGSTTFDFASIAANTTSDTTIAVVGAMAGDPVAVTVDALESGLTLSAFVSGAGIVTVRLGNVTIAAIDPISHIYQVMVFSYAGF